MEVGFLPEEICKSQVIMSFGFQGLVEGMKEETNSNPVRMENLMENLLESWATSPGQEWARNKLRQPTEEQGKSPMLNIRSGWKENTLLPQVSSYI